MIYFTYKTTNLINNKTYIGIHHTEDIDDGYLGSGVALKKAIKKYGKENFTREILSHHDSFDELLEVEKELVNEEWVNNRNNYNLKTGGQSSGLLSEESKLKISNTLKKKYESGELIPKYTAPYVATNKQKKQISETLKERYKNQEHHLKNIEPWNKGKVGVQEAWNKGVSTGPMSEEQKKDISNTLKGRFKNQEHHSKGCIPWNKGKTNLPSSWNKGIKMEKLECPHCSKLVDKANGKRWHFDNCKHKESYAASSGADKLCNG
jgi:hypothetical protein